MLPNKKFTMYISTFFSVVALTTAMNLEQCNIARSPGYLGSPLADAPNHGDLVTQTYCFCQKPKEQRTENPGNKDLGISIQIEYYNEANNMTYGLCHQKRCHHSDQDDQIDICFLEETKEGVTPVLKAWDGDFEPLVRSWPIDPNDPHGPREFLSFIANTHKFGNENHPKANYMSYHRVFRNLGPWGGQRYRKVENGVQDVCTQQCREFLGMGLATATGVVQPSYQVLNDVDPICSSKGCNQS